MAFPYDGGRPLKLSEDRVLKAEVYIDSCTESIETTDKGQLAWMEVKFPSLAGLALAMDVSKETINQWGKGSLYEGAAEPSEEEAGLLKRVSVVIRRVRLEQESRLLQGGLGKKYDPRITGLILATHHGYSDKQDITSGGEKLPTPILNVLPDASDKKDTKPE